MLDEYAVEPEAIAASWSDFRYLIEKFGFRSGPAYFEVSFPVVQYGAGGRESASGR
jgi:hypothetical protein